MESKKQPLGIYVHIPFCIKKCAYCDFLSFSADAEKKSSYISAVLKEIEGYKEIKNSYDIKSIYFGGGTPSVLDAELLCSVLEKLSEVFSIDESKKKEIEITVECNPGTIGREKLTAYATAGINRLSIGLQSAWNEELKMLGRIHTYEEFISGYHLAREAGFHNISIDVMSALPGQSFEGFQKGLEKIVSHKPEHLSVYGLIIEEGTSFWEQYEKQQVLLPSEETDRAMYTWTGEFLEIHGYHRYEISNYAKNGYDSIHNTGYWIRNDYVGIGLGASSFLLGERFRNTEMMQEYLEGSHDFSKIRKDVQKLTKETAMEEFMFLGLRLMRGVSRKEFYKTFGMEIDSVFERPIEQMKKAGLLDEKEERIFLTNWGINVSNLVMSEFLF